MGDELDSYHGVFTYYKTNQSISVNNTITNVENSLCYKWAEGLDQNVTEQFCHPMHPCSDDGLLLPIFFEDTWPVNFRIVIYLVGLLYSFLGVSIIADIFMCAIEKITSKTKTIYLSSAQPGGSRESVEVQVWNATVANLTLMALGSSAPEILLSIIEIVGNNFEAGELGPGTIVGSAAFNLMVISAVCVSGIPKGETRRIEMIGVFAVTASFSIFAYVWLVIVLKFSSENVIDIWEAVLTCLFFPILVCIAYAADKRWFDVICCRRKKTLDLDQQRQIELGTVPTNKTPVKADEFFQNGELDDKSMIKFIRTIKTNTKLSDQDAAILAASKIIDSQSHSRMWYRIGAIRHITGGRKISPSAKMNDKLRYVYDAINENPECPTIDIPPEDDDASIVEFEATSVSVLENKGKCQVSIIRSGQLNQQVMVKVHTIEGSAEEVADYEPIDKILTFNPGETKKVITVNIVDDDQWEPDENFFVKLSVIPEKSKDQLIIGARGVMEVTILNDDDPGEIQFKKRGYLIKESCVNADVDVIRSNGVDGKVSVKWKATDKSIKKDKEREETSDETKREGTLHFKHGENCKKISIPIVNEFKFNKKGKFEVELFEPNGGATLGKVTKTYLNITNDNESYSVLRRTLVKSNIDVNGMRVDSSTWAQQLKDAMNVNGGDYENATTLDYVMHFLTFGFKMIFALVPPPSIGGGWPCFAVALLMIGILTAIVGDLATIFGCLVGLKPPVTAITFVALGTSLPDTFASKAAATGEKTADNAIGNITGSNGVNVFLGLGTSWLIASIYHSIKGTTFKVDDPSLSFSVSIFSIFAVITIAFFMMRRTLEYFGKAELGGPQTPRIITSAFFVILWLLYVLLASLQTYKIIDGF